MKILLLGNNGTYDKYYYSRNNFLRKLYIHVVIEDKEMYNIKDDYDYCKEQDNRKEKDDF